MTTPPLSAQHLEQAALAAYGQGRWQEALRDFRLAQEQFAAAGAADRAAELANNIAVTCLQAKRPQEALDACLGTPEVFLERGDVLRAAQACGNLAAAHEACGHLAEAEQAYRQALSLFAQTDDADNRARTYTALSQLQLRRRSPLAALSTMRAGLEQGARLNLLQRLLRHLMRFLGRLISGSG